jgi:hypothetical protein
MDRGYTDCARWTLAGVLVVTRMKDNAVFAVEAEFEVPENRNIRADQIIQLKTAGSAHGPWRLANSPAPR